MGVAAPEMMADTFMERFNKGEVAAACALYTETAVFTYDGADKAIGRKQIERALAGFASVGLKIHGAYLNMHVNGDLALGRMKWELRDASGASVSNGVSAEVLQRGADGLWRITLDDVGGGARGA